MADQRGFFGLDERYRALPAAGDPLERLASMVDVAVFRTELDGALARADRRFSLSSAPVSPSRRPSHLERQHKPNRAS
ncbi:hypothetical protein DF3PA_170059 [Candidatus Defluviicoccus seviourii]|uniref:Transposase n=2 Tax=root TaxID=1 RepID=A0A564WDB1_9PROT|nr:hypothetical protein DF3PB_80004 [uncultured Defluviicoccus sp.]VUX45958.1 hypothetical protein DF3PA_170059 [Candidatus Defluviicoccus seviourii]